MTLSIFALDVDHFKKINDTLGHDIGDEVLKGFASRVKNTLRKNDIIARIGGDEFVILLPDLTDKTNVKEIAERIQLSLSVSGANMQISTSIGIAFYNDFELNAKTLYKQADMALYEAKEKGRNNY